MCVCVCVHACVQCSRLPFLVYLTAKFLTPRRQAFVKRKGTLPAISIELVQMQMSVKPESWTATQPAAQVVVGETYVINEDVSVKEDELLLSGGEHVRVLSGDGQGNFLVETKDGESGWISRQHLRDERQSEGMKSRGI